MHIVYVIILSRRCSASLLRRTMTLLARSVRHEKVSGDYWVMQNVCVRAKHNSQVGEWSQPVYVIHTLPADGALPEGTAKNHVFKKSTCKGNILKQTRADLADKMKELWKTVNLVESKFSGTWTDVDYGY